MTAPTEIERSALLYDPFLGEDVRRKLIDDKMVLTRRLHGCVICIETIEVGARARSTTEILMDGQHRKVATFYTCPVCVVAEASSWVDAGKAIEERTSIGIRNAEARRVAHG